MLTIDRKVYDPESGRQVKKAGRKGTPHRRIIKRVVIGGYEFTYHATRGWRRGKI